jgi:hypothetical protein
MAGATADEKAANPIPLPKPRETIRKYQQSETPAATLV